jgi:hypothetical protein
MGATNGYCRPVNPTGGRISSWAAHTNRGVPSVEPGVDYYCPRGTPVKAAASGRVSDVGDSIMPATGRYVTIDLDDGRRVRYLHLERRHVKVGDRVQWGQHIADSGATGYGEADWSWNVAGTGGAHVHMTLFRNHSYTFGRYATLDPERYMAANQATPTPSTPAGEEDEDEMSRNIMYRTTDTKAKIRAAVVNDTSGLWIEFTANDAGPLNDHAKAFNTGDAMTVSTSMFTAARSAAEAVRAGK